MDDSSLDHSQARTVAIFSEDGGKYFSFLLKLNLREKSISFCHFHFRDKTISVTLLGDGAGLGLKCRGFDNGVAYFGGKTSLHSPP